MRTLFWEVLDRDNNRFGTYGIDICAATSSTRTAIIGLSRLLSSSNSMTFEIFWSFEMESSMIN
jgi:hypothetical protein